MRWLILSCCLAIWGCSSEEGRPATAAGPEEAPGTIVLQLHFAGHAKLAAVDLMTVFVSQSGTEITRQDLTRNGDRGQGTISVAPGTYTVAVASFEADAINMMGSTTVEVAAGTPTPASISMAVMVPQDLRVEDTGGGIFRVLWSGVTGATAYLLQEGREDAFAAPQGYPATTTSTTVTLSSGDYYYRVRAACEYGASRWSGTAHLAVGATGAAISIDVAWDRSLDAPSAGPSLVVVGTPTLVRGSYTDYQTIPDDFYASEYGSDASITGEIRNNGAADATDVLITVSLRDAAGNLVARVPRYSVGTVRAGQSESFTVYVQGIFASYDDPDPRIEVEFVE